MTHQPGKQTIAIHILYCISKSKGNQVMRSGKLVEYNKITITFQNLYITFGGEIGPGPFSKIKIDRISALMV